MLKIKYLIAPIFWLSSLYGAVFDAMPSDYVAPKPGTQIMSVNLLGRDLVGPYNKGERLTNDAISQKTLYLRYNYIGEVGDYSGSLGFALPFSNLVTKGATLEEFIGKESTGASDFVLSSTIWLVNDKINREFLGVSLLLVLPTGKFEESQTLNSGENRYKYILYMGYIKPLSEKFTLELSPELAFYGENQNKTTKQKPSAALNTNLRYRINQTYEIFGGYQYSYNSETIANGIEQNNDFSSNKYSLGGFYYTQRYNQFMIRFAKESSKEFGMKTNKELLLRYLWWF